MANVKRLASAAWTADQIFVSATGAAEGVIVENTGFEPLVSLYYSGPNTQPSAPNVRDHKPC